VSHNQLLVQYFQIFHAAPCSQLFLESPYGVRKGTVPCSPVVGEAGLVVVGHLGVVESRKVERRMGVVEERDLVRAERNMKLRASELAVVLAVGALVGLRQHGCAMCGRERGGWLVWCCGRGSQLMPDNANTDVSAHMAIGWKGPTGAVVAAVADCGTGRERGLTIYP
jgi:hypothetical protein